VALELHPLEQFKIEKLIPLHIGGIDISYTNSGLFMTVAVVLITALLVLPTRRRALVPGRWQSVAEISYEFVADMVETNAGHGAEPYFPFVFSLFMFVLLANFLGLVPYSFTVTSHIIVTFALAATVFIGVTIIGFVKHGAHFLRLFVPEGVPLVLLLLLVPIERAVVLFHPPVHPVDPVVCQYARRAYDAGDLRRVCRQRRPVGDLSGRARCGDPRA
jgi:F-type H+-transporting ATPase subunit a